MPGAAIDIHELVKRFGDVTAVDRVSFQVKHGESVAVVGPEGAGKSTLFRVLATLLPPTSGSAAIAGLDVVQRRHDVRRAIGVVPREPIIDPELTVAENLRIFAALHAVPGTVWPSRVANLLAVVELTSSAGLPVSQLTTGERRRVELARALLHEPRVLLLDEPTAGLDTAAREHAWASLKRVTATHDLTVLLTTRELDEARALCDRVVELERGKLCGASGRSASSH